MQILFKAVCSRLQIREDGSLSDEKLVPIGVKPISLSRFTMAGTPYIFAATDRPSIVHEHNGKLQYSPVNEANISHLCSFSTESFPGAVAITKDQSLMIALLDTIQKLHIRCVDHWVKHPFCVYRWFFDLETATLEMM